MNTILGRIHEVAGRQHGAIAHWQHRELELSPAQMSTALRGLRKVHHGVRAIGDLTERGWFMAAALAGGPKAFVSHRSALMVLGLLPYEAADIYVTVEGRAGRRDRQGLVFHRPTGRIDAGTAHGIPVTSPTQSLQHAGLERDELYRALDLAELLGHPVSLPLTEITALHQRVRGRTKSIAEARFVLLCHDHGIPLPHVNHHLNGFETDFHWPHAKLVVEVDGWEFHKERPQFEQDRGRGLIHNAAGYTVTRASALQVEHQPELVAAAARSFLPH
jgi:very-short-patch-repair endonuclease